MNKPITLIILGVIVAVIGVWIYPYMVHNLQHDYEFAAWLTSAAIVVGGISTFIYGCIKA